ncbi:ABC transporter permease (plasmid) [Mesorhizobium loti]|uniref:ABC transporter, permease n=1 Tax=Mesorhizobium japonicum (strain LMG 29417 / CECT 9101 / MAFF 303099) TaxID=266835 RepID=Q982L1_RHILO|nr:MULTISPECIES: ABC transporter permease [Mesorhizobium]BAB54445.1 ABC transporter, permease [Mesorhizobium japonicum MAFF 303099]BAV52752.1 ABC transporter permease [Mesorhizobium loti]BCH04883.1 ABC transporter permease [Mesorhizobium sp. 131-2-5]
MTAIENPVAPLPSREKDAPIRKPPIRLLLLPAGTLIGLLLVCALVVLRMSVGERNAEWTGWSLRAYMQLASSRNLGIIIDTIWMALLSALITTLVAFPIALFLTRTTSPIARRLVLIAILLPMIISLLVQSFGWMAILGPNGLLNQAISAATGIERPFSLLFNRAGVMLGLVQTSIPLAVLPAAAALRSIPLSLEEAANVLGANRIRTYRHIILPLAWPGMAAGAILVFGFNTGAFVVPLLLGGLKVTTIAVVIRDQMGSLSNWPLGAALSVLLILLALAVQSLNRLIVRTNVEIKG